MTRAGRGAPAMRAMGRPMSFLESRQQVAPQGIGKRLRRREDARFLTGAGKYADDMSLPGQVYAYVVRSPHAHARILGFGVGPAAGAPGVFAVLTGTDAAADGLQPIPQRPVPANPHEVPLKSRDGAPFLIAPHPVLALGKTRYVGEPVAVVVAETLWQAMDAAERLAVEYNPRWSGRWMHWRSGRRSPGRSTVQICASTLRPATRRRPSSPSPRRRMSCG
jgi:xanthine dehydrogenase molybdopterin-binding subunit B